MIANIAVNWKRKMNCTQIKFQSDTKRFCKKQMHCFKSTIFTADELKHEKQEEEHVLDTLSF